MLSDWIFILLAEHLAVSARNGLMGSSVLHILGSIKGGLYSPSFYFIFTGRAGLSKPIKIWRLLERIFTAVPMPFASLSSWST